MVLTLPKNQRKSLEILDQLCEEDLVKLCMLQGWCLPGYYPFCFPHQIRSGSLGNVPLLVAMTASNSSSKLLKKLVNMDNEVKLPKNIILKDEENRLTAYLSANVLAPTSEFSFIETADSFLVTKINEDVDDESEAFSSDEEINKSDEDDDVLYCYHGPHPSSRQELDNSIEDNELPTPPYTPYTFHDRNTDQGSLSGINQNDEDSVGGETAGEEDIGLVGGRTSGGGGGGGQ